MKTKRRTLTLTAELKAFLDAEGAHTGVSVAELVRIRCELGTTESESVLASWTSELRSAVGMARASIADNLAEADAAISEVRARRIAAASPPPRRTPTVRPPP
jgi:hypothetical protein